MEAWRCLPWSAGDAALELASGSAMLAGLAPLDDAPGSPPRPALRWYSVGAPALVLGAGQPIQQVDTAACAAAGVPLHRRSSGGTSVLLEPTMLMQDVALPRGHRLYTSDVTESYRWLGEVWVATLVQAGLPARVIEVAEARADTQALDRLTRLSCYGGRSPYEVLIDGRKLVGFAQVRRRSGMLLQVGLYTHWSPAHLAVLLALTPADRDTLVERLTARVAGLALDVQGHWSSAAHVSSGLGCDLVSPHMYAPVIAAFADALWAMHGVALTEAVWSSVELTARAQAYSRYTPIDTER